MKSSTIFEYGPDILFSGCARNLPVDTSNQSVKGIKFEDAPFQSTLVRDLVILERETS